MAGVFGVAQTVQIATGTSEKTLLQIVAAANHGIRITGWGISFEGTSPTGTPIEVKISRQTTAGTMSSLTPVKKRDSDGDTLDTTAQHTATAEPTEGDIVRKMLVHPQGGYSEHFPLGAEIFVGAGDRLGLIVTSAADVDAVGFFDFEE